MAVLLQQHVESRHGRELADLLAAVAGAAMQIERSIRTASLADHLGAYGQVNVQGEQQQKLDVFANEVMIAALEAVPTVAAVVSEENEEPVLFPNRPHARFVAIFDPLDGSSNIDVNVNVGTIVSVQQIGPEKDALAAALKPGTAQVAALYVNYGPATMLVYTAGAGVHSFTLADEAFVQTADNVRMPAFGPYYSVNEGNLADFSNGYREYLAGLRDGSLLGRKYSSRYVGSFIADFHRTLLKGGVFLYPPTAKTPQGKLRLLYEANPLAWIAEEAGGAAVTGSGENLPEQAAGSASPAKPPHGDRSQRILEITPTGLHARTTLVIGSRAEVTAFESAHRVAAQSEASS